VRSEKGEGRREKGEGRREKGEGSWSSLFPQALEESQDECLGLAAVTKRGERDLPGDHVLL
jgi:hypothetical protein